MPDPASEVAAFDRLYQMLIDAHRGLSPDASRRLDARLVILLAERVGDLEAVCQTVRAALEAEPGAGTAEEAQRSPSARRPG